jgi:hypothetical protein
VPGVVGEPYRDASANEYLPMFVQSLLVCEADSLALRRAYERAMSRGVTPAIYTHELTCGVFNKTWNGVFKCEIKANA